MFAIHHGVQVFVQLILNALQYMGMPVARIAYRNPGNQIQIFSSVGGVNPGSFGPIDFECNRGMACLCNVFKKVGAGTGHA